MTDSGNAGRRLEPDFARHALALLNAGNAAQAEQIAREGTTWFPWYATGHHVHSRSLELLGQREDAFTAAQIALKLLPDSIFLRSEVERLALPSLSTTEPANVVTNPANPAAETVQDARESEPESDEPYRDDGVLRPVSATLAEIYVRQGELNEAIRAYRALVNQEPGGPDKYGARLNELEEMLRQQLYG